MTTTALRTGSAAIPEAASGVPASTAADQDAAIDALRCGAATWAALAISDRIALLEALIESTAQASEQWALAGCELKSIAPETPAAAEEWLGGPYAVLRHLRLLAATLRDVRDHGAPRLPGAARVRDEGQVVAPVFPTGAIDKILFRGVSAETWLQPELAQAGLADAMAGLYRRDSTEPRVALVLGAGNVSSIGPLDALQKLFTEGEVVLLKMNPVNAAVGPALEVALAPLVERDFVRFVYGGAEVGARLASHPGVDSLHITGSDRTHDAIVWGTGDEAVERKRRGEPLNARPITSELGNVSPVIVVPGPWSRRDLEYHGKNLASSLTTNAGFNCNATRVIVQHADWDQRDALLAATRRALAGTPDRVPYYPGAQERHAAFVAAHPEARQLGGGPVPWTLIERVDPTATSDVCFQTEAWCGVMAETALPAPDPAAFLDEAVRFANESLWGTLNVTLLVHPRSLRDPSVTAALERAVADLRYGTVSINMWAAASFVLGSTTWGAFPGHTLDDVRSGIGVVHNTYLFDRPQKTVVRAPFRMVPEPAWFHTNRTGHIVARRLTRFASKPSAWNLMRVLLAAVGATAGVRQRPPRPRSGIVPGP